MAKTKSWTRWWLELTRRFECAIAWSKRASTAFARPSVLAALLAVLTPVCVILIRSTLHATVNTITVDTIADPGTSSQCSLRAAINNANNKSSGSSTCAAGTGTDTIVFSVSGTIALTSNLPQIKNNLTIDGSGQTITVDGTNGSVFQMLEVLSVATLNLNNLTIAHGHAYAGGGIYNDGGTLTVTNSTLSGNSATSFGGGGIYDLGGTLTVTNTTFSHNSATGSTGGGI